MDTNKNKIRKALEEALSRSVGLDPFTESHIRQALAELDKAQQPGKVLTEDEIDAAFHEYMKTIYGEHSAARMDKGQGFIHGLCYARDNGYLAPAAGLTVEEVERIMDVVTPFLMHKYQETECRARLTTALEAKRTA